MSQVLFDGVSMISAEATRLTCEVKVPLGRRLVRIMLAILGGFFGLVAVSAAVRSGHGISSGERAVWGVVAMVIGALFALFALEVWRRWRVQTTIFETSARSLHDADGARLAGLDEVTIAARPFQESTAGSLLGGISKLSMMIVQIATPTAGGRDDSDKACEVAATWIGGERVLSEPCTWTGGEELAARLTELTRKK